MTEKTCSLLTAARKIGVGPHQILDIIHTHPDIFSGVNTKITPDQVRVSISDLETFQTLYRDACPFSEIVERLGVSVKRIQKVAATPDSGFLGRSFCFPGTCPKSGRPSLQRRFPRKDAEEFIDYCETRGIFKFLESNVRVGGFTYATLEKEEVVSASKAYRYKDAVADGFSPQKYRSSDIEPGTYVGKLVFKIWGGRSVIRCYFVLEDDTCIFLNARRPSATPWRGFTPRDGRTDFSRPGIEGTCYRITTGLTENGTVVFLSARAAAQGSSLQVDKPESPGEGQEREGN